MFATSVNFFFLHPLVIHGFIVVNLCCDMQGTAMGKQVTVYFVCNVHLRNNVPQKILKMSKSNKMLFFMTEGKQW